MFWEVDAFALADLQFLLCQKSRVYMSKETYLYDKRDMFIWQKRCVYMSKETGLYDKTDVSSNWVYSKVLQFLLCQKKPCLYVKIPVSSMSKEPCLYVERAVLDCQKSRVHMTKETCLHVERDGSISRKRRIVQLCIQQSLAISTWSMELCLYVKRAVFECQKRRVYTSEEPCLIVKRAVFIWQKRLVYMSKETGI